jgi:hypothetical protein
MDARLKEQTRAEWRELGFFYDVARGSKQWRLIGPRDGLRNFSELLRAYAADSRNLEQSEHEHYGPYLYLKVMTWPEAGIDGDTIHGPLDALARLAALVDDKITGLEPGQEARIQEDYAPGSEYALVLELRDETFDPAAADPNLGGDGEPTRQ